MFAWLALLIPCITAVVLYKKYNHRTLWWEFLIPFLASILLIGLSKFGIESLQTRDTEYWGGWVVRAEYYEDWNEEVVYYETHRDSKGNTRRERKTRIEYHPARWLIIDSNDCEVNINSNVFESLSGRFGNRRFVELRRNYHTNDGDLYITEWNRRDEDLIPVTTQHSYENRVAASDSVFNFAEVDPKTYGLYDYPEITDFYKCQSILGSGDQTQVYAERELSVWNARLGRSKQVRMLILLFKNQPIQAGFEQENYWKGGNKNEFVVTIGLDDHHNVTWCHAFSWTEVEDLKVDTREYVMGQKSLNLQHLVNWMAVEVNTRFKRKEFHDFDYLTIEPPGWAIFLVFVLVTGLNIGISSWVIHNEHSDRSGGGAWRARL